MFCFRSEAYLIADEGSCPICHGLRVSLPEVSRSINVDCGIEEIDSDCFLHKVSEEVALVVVHEVLRDLDWRLFDA